MDLGGMSGSLPLRGNLGALFLSVWTIYLLDRIYDVFRNGTSAELTVRHEWARRHVSFLSALVVVTAGALTIEILPGLGRATFLAGLGLLAITLLYYVVFRFSLHHSCFFSRIPAKELTIGVCFATGILIAVSPDRIGIGLAMMTGALALLVSANCLLIGRAEREFDSRLDAAAYFAVGREESDFRLPEKLIFLSMAASILVAVGGGFLFSSIALFACGSMTLVLARFERRGWKTFMQAGADGVHLFPWFLIAGKYVSVKLL